MEQTLINWGFAGAGAALGWILKVVWDAIQDLKKDIRQIERDLPEVYVRRDDFKDAVKELKEDMKAGFISVDATLRLIFKKLDDNKE
jgi:hypothetical protein